MARDYMGELIYIIGQNESGNNYTSINATEVVSIGIFNWYGARALSLARNIVALDPSGSQSALSGATNPLYSQITSGNNNVWNNYVPGNSSDDMDALRRFLDLPASHTAQDALANVDGQGYVSQAKSMGIVVPAAQIYFADLYNQSPKRAVEIVNAAGGGAMCSLEVIHKYAMMNPVMSKYSSRRNWTYNELASWSGDSGGGYQPPVTPPVNPPSGEWEGENVDSLNKKYYIVRWNEHLALFSSDHPNGLIFIPSGNVFIPLDPYVGVEVTIVDSVEEMVDHSKVYVLSSTGYIWVWNGVEFIDTNVKYQFPG